MIALGRREQQQQQLKVTAQQGTGCPERDEPTQVRRVDGQQNGWMLLIEKMKKKKEKERKKGEEESKVEVWGRVFI